MTDLTKNTVNPAEKNLLYVGAPGNSIPPTPQLTFFEKFPNLTKPKSDNPINQIKNEGLPENSRIPLERALIFARKEYGINGVIKFAKLLFNKPPSTSDISALVVALHDKGDRMGRGQYSHLHRARNITIQISQILYEATCDNIVKNPKNYLSEAELERFRQGNFRENILNAIKDINYTFERKEEVLRKNNEMKKGKNLFFYTAIDGLEAELSVLGHDTVEDGYLERHHLEEIGVQKNVIDIMCHLDKYEYLPRMEKAELRDGKRLFSASKEEQAIIAEEYEKYFIKENILYDTHGAGAFSKENINWDEVVRYLGGYFKPLIKRAEEGDLEKNIKKFSPNKMIKLLQTKLADLLDNKSPARNDLVYSDTPNNPISKTKIESPLGEAQAARAKKSRTNIVKYDIAVGINLDYFLERFGIKISHHHLSTSHFSAVGAENHNCYSR